MVGKSKRTLPYGMCGMCNKSKFKTAIINPLIDHNFLELTIPESPRSPSQKYRLTGKFVRRRTKD